MTAPVNDGKVGAETARNVLLIRHLPSSLTAEKKQDLIRHFGAIHVKVLSNSGRMKHTAFATFRDHSSAKEALFRLHQSNIEGHTLVVEYARKIKSDSQLDSSLPDEDRTDTPSDGKAKSQDAKLAREKSQEGALTGQTQPKSKTLMTGFLTSDGIELPFIPQLRYCYPPPTKDILTNVVHAISSHPRLYTQVLHLMNKMNIPAPFGVVTPAPPLMTDAMHEPSSVDNETVTEMDVSSSSEEEESEIESDPEEAEKAKKARVSLKRPSKPKNPRRPKRPKLQPLLPQRSLGNPPPPAANTAPQPARTAAVDVFEQTQTPAGKKIEFRLAESSVGTAGDSLSAPRVSAGIGERLAVIETTQEPSVPDRSDQPSGFGTFEPLPTEKGLDAGAKEPEEDEEEQEDEGEGLPTEYISRQELRNRLPDHEMKRHSVFKHYEAGEPTMRLYLKNLAKTVEEKDLKYIYGRYIDWTSPIDKDMFTIQLMTQGRMKGQAFIGLPSEFSAGKALKDTNGLILQGKPVVVQFARSAKVKDKEEKNNKAPPTRKLRKEI